MKRFLFSLGLFLMCNSLWSQIVLVVVYAISDDGILNVRAQPSSKAQILTTLPMAFHGLGRGILLEQGDRWSKVKVGDIVGWVYTRYMGGQSWYSDSGKPTLVAAKRETPLYTGNYVLKTGHDYLFINKNDVIVK